jgi:hypothetical protein
MTCANLGLATIVRNRLKKANPGVAYELVRVRKGFRIVPSAKVEPAVVPPEIKVKTEPEVAGETVKFVVRMRSLSAKWIVLLDPMPGGTIWVFRRHVLAINPLPDGDKSELVVPLKVAKSKGWAAQPGIVAVRRVQHAHSFHPAAAKVARQAAALSPSRAGS